MTDRPEKNYSQLRNLPELADPAHVAPAAAAAAAVAKSVAAVSTEEVVCDAGITAHTHSHTHSCNCEESNLYPRIPNAISPPFFRCAIAPL